MATATTNEQKAVRIATESCGVVGISMMVLGIIMEDVLALGAVRDFSVLGLCIFFASIATYLLVSYTLRLCDYIDEKRAQELYRICDAVRTKGAVVTAIPRLSVSGKWCGLHVTVVSGVTGETYVFETDELDKKFFGKEHVTVVKRPKTVAPYVILPQCGGFVIAAN
jgi:hypothetical protein